MRLFDTHVHLLSRNFKTDIAGIIDAFDEDKIVGVIEASTDEDNARDAVKLAEANDKIYCAVGIHPHDAKGVSKDYVKVLADLATSKKNVAIGEIGLDYYYDHSPREMQMDVFRAQLALAKDLNKPIIIHSRDATKDMMDTLLHFGQINGVMHCFSGSTETALACIKLGLHLSFTGTLTFKNAKKVRDTFSALPLDRIMAETDCPYMTPEPHRGKRNMPKYVAHVITKMAEIKGISADEMAEINITNAKNLFGV